MTSLTTMTTSATTFTTATATGASAAAAAAVAAVIIIVITSIQVRCGIKSQASYPVVSGKPGPSPLGCTVISGQGLLVRLRLRVLEVISLKIKGLLL